MSFQRVQRDDVLIQARVSLQAFPLVLLLRELLFSQYALSLVSQALLLVERLLLPCNTPIVDAFVLIYKHYVLRLLHIS